MEKIYRNNEIKLIDLPICTIRRGQIFNGAAIITCGYNPVDPEECIKCGGDLSKNI